MLFFAHFCYQPFKKEDLFMATKKKKKRWVRSRHRFVISILRVFFHPYCRLRYGAVIKRFKEEEKRPYLVLFNHQTAFDQFFVALSFRQHLYFIASEDLFSKGFLSACLRFLVAPIPIKKQTTDIRAIMNCMHVAKEGGSIAMAPEGNRTYRGKTEYMSPTVAPLARKLGMPIVLYRIEGGYGVQPRWANNVRRGRMNCYVSRVIYPEEYASLTDDELFAIIRDGLYVDEANADNVYRSKKSAEYLERVIYYCPNCGFSEFESHKDILECKKCHLKVRYLPTTGLQGIGREVPYRFLSDWYDAQSAFMNSKDPFEFTDAPVFTDSASMFLVVPNKKKVTVDKNAEISLYGDRIFVRAGGETFDFAFDKCTAVTILGRNKVNIYYDGNIYQLKGACSFNGLKYVHMFNRYSNVKKGDSHGSFLGL